MSQIKLSENFIKSTVKLALNEDLYPLGDLTTNLIKNKKIKISNFGTFSIRSKKKRIGRNPKTKESKIISERNVVLFKPSNQFKDFINLKQNDHDK